MTSTQSDQLKVIGLVVGVLAIFGYIFVTIVNSQTGTQSTNPVQAAEVVASNLPVEPVPEEGMIDLPTGTASLEFNPFRKAVHPLPPKRPVVGSGLPYGGSAIANGIPSGDGNGPLLPSVDIGALEQASLDDLKVTIDGVIIGPRPVAIIRTDKSTMVLTVGQTVADGVVIKHIGESGIELKKGKAIRHIQVGPSPVASKA